MSVIRPFAYTVVADSVGPEDESSSGDDQRASMTIQIDLSKNKGLQRADIYGSILGFPVYHPQILQGSNPKITLPYMTRVLPWRHPYLRWLWATTISNVQGRKWVSKNWAPAIASFPLPGPGYSGNLYSGYKYLRLTIGYTCPPYDVLSDAQVGAFLTTYNAGATSMANPLAEFKRFQEEEFEFSQELITRKGTYYRWSKAVVGRFIHGLEGQTIDIGLTIRAAKGVVIRRWHQVPKWGLFGPTGRGRPQPIIDGIAKINESPISLTGFIRPQTDNAPTQYEKGTLLCLPPKFIRTNACVPNSYMYPAWTPGKIQSAIDIDDFPPRTYVVEQRWLFFDPPVEPGYPLRGHNLVPIPTSKQFGGIVPTQTPFFYMVSLGNDLAEVTGANTIVNKGIYTHYPFEYFTQVY